MHARGIEHHSHGVQNCLGAINLVLASGRIGRPKCGYGTITGQGNGQGGREHGQKCDQLPGWRDIANPEHRALHRRRLGRRPRTSCPDAGVDCYEMFRKIDAGEIKGLLSICFNPMVSLPDNDVRHAHAREAGVLRRDRLLPERDGPARRRRPARLSLHEEDEGTVAQVEGRVIKINKAVDCPGRGAAGLADHPGHRRRRSAGRTASRSTSPREIFEELRRREQGRRRRLLGHHLREDRAADGRLLAVLARTATAARSITPARRGSSSRESWNPVAKGAGPFYFPDGKARFNVADYRPPAEDVDDEYPVILTTGRVVSQFLSGTQTRRIGPLVDQYPEPRLELHPRLADEARHRATATGRRSRRAAARSRCAPWS